MNVRSKFDHSEPLQTSVAARVCGYFRVSTGRQAESDLSIPDQRKQILNHCTARGLKFVAEFVDAGASGMEEDRTEFQKMIRRALDDDRPFDLIIVHSFSRFFRDAFGLEMYVRKLAKAGVRLVSITQELGDDPAQVMMRQVIAMFDEYSSRENAKHVLRAMNENARQGFYNGSPLPLGYTAVEVEKRGNKSKKKLSIDPVEAETVKLIFALYLRGDGVNGPLGLKALVCWLNERGHRTRKGARFGFATVHKILVNTVYIGQWVFNRTCARDGRAKPVKDHIIVDVPKIISEADFAAVTATLKSRNPKVTPPRIVTGPVLLTGMTFCATCDGAMTLRTGTSKSGKVHKYYSCSSCNRMGKTACKGRTIPMQKLDTLVTDHLCERLLRPERLNELLAAIVSRRAKQALEVDKRVAALQGEISEAEIKIKRLYQMVEDDVTDLDDILRDRLTALKLNRDIAKTALSRINDRSITSDQFSSEAIEAFGYRMREKITNGDVPFRKAYIGSIIERIEVADNVIRIIGNKSDLEQAIGGKPPSSKGVRSFARKWCSQGEGALTQLTSIITIT